MIFQQSAVDEWVEMSRICLGLLMKCAQHPNPEIVAMATAKLHTVLQVRATEDLHELGYLMFSINKALDTAIESMYKKTWHLLISLRKINSTLAVFFLQNFYFQRSFSNFKTVGDTEGYSFLMPVLKALLEKSRSILNLTAHVPDLPPTASGPVFFNDFQMYITTKQWCSFIEKKVFEKA